MSANRGLSGMVKSFWYTILSTFGVSFTLQTCVPMLKNDVISKYPYSTKGIFFNRFDIINSAITIFLFAFFAMISFCFIVKAIYNLWLFFYCFLFCNDRYNKVQINVDEDNVIKDSYMEFSNGDRIPMYITKIISKADPNKPDDNINGGIR